jgi:hypothetical protein
VDGKKVLLGLAPGTKEGTASTRPARLEEPQPVRSLLVSSDGAPGLMRAL